MLTTILLALAGTVVAMIVGTFWHSPMTPMGKLHMKYVGFNKLSTEEQQRAIEEAKPTMWKSYLGQSLLSFLLSFSIVFIISMSVQNGVPALMAAGFGIFNWLTFMVPVIGGNIIWGNVDREIAWPKFFSDIGFNLVTVLLISGLVILFV